MKISRRELFCGLLAFLFRPKPPVKMEVVYGYTNFPVRRPQTVTPVPLSTSPFMLYCSSEWDKYLDDDCSPLENFNGGQTLRQKLQAVKGNSE